MSYTDAEKKFLRGKIALVADDKEAYTFDSFSSSWKKISIFNPEATSVFVVNGTDAIDLTYDSSFDYEENSLAMSINLTNVDSNGDTINWNFVKEDGHTSKPGNPALVTLRNNKKLQIAPQNIITKNNQGEVSATNIGASSYISIFTSDSPSFTGIGDGYDISTGAFDSIRYNTFDGKKMEGRLIKTHGSEVNRFDGRYEMTLEYTFDGASIIAFNTSKILDLIQFGAAKVFFQSTNTGSRLTSSNGIVYVEETEKFGINTPSGEEPLAHRLYRMQNGTSVQEFENPRRNTLQNLHSSNNLIGTYSFKNDVVAGGKGLALTRSGDKMFALSTSATTHPPATIVEYDIDSAYDIKTSRYRTSEYNDIYVGSKSKFLKRGKYFYTIRYVNYTGNVTPLQIYSVDGKLRPLFSYLYYGYYFDNGGTDWPLYPYLYRYTVEEDYSSTDSGLVYKIGENYDQRINLMHQGYAQSLFTYGYPSYAERQFTGVNNWSGPYWFWSHYGPVTGFDVDSDGEYLYTVTGKAATHGAVFQMRTSSSFNINTLSPSSFNAGEGILHSIGEGTNIRYSANFKTNGVWDIKVNKTGTSIYLLDAQTKAIYQYDMSTAHDISSLNRSELMPIDKTIDTNGYDERLLLTDIPATAAKPPLTFNQEAAANMPNISGLSTNQRQNAIQRNDFRDFSMVRSFDFNNDGSRLYVNNDNRVYQYNLSTPFSLSTASFISSTEAYREHLFDNHMTLGTGIDIDSNENKFYVSSHRYSLNKENQGSIKEFNLTDSVGSGTMPYNSKIHVLDSDNWGDIHLNSDGTRMYISGPNKIKRLTFDSVGKLSSLLTDSTYEWDSAVKFSGDLITTNTDESKIYVGDSSNTIRMVSLGDVDSVKHIGLNYETVAPGTQNTQMTGMLWMDNEKSFIVSGNNQLENYRTKDSFEINDI
tara:strand:+ start:813 stop:3593 length:2781 start_codon:yes stop_codon:yes gene_type:complete